MRYGTPDKPLDPKFRAIQSKDEITGFVKVKAGPLVFHVPKLKNGKLLLFKCRPNCGRCCYPHHLTLLPRDVENLAKKEGMNEAEFLVKKTVISKGKVLPMLKTLEKERCQYLNKSEKCTIYPIRPHPCRIYPFQYDKDGQVGILEEAMNNCPGLYQGNSIKAAEDLYVAIANETVLGMKEIKSGLLLLQGIEQENVKPLNI